MSANDSEMTADPEEAAGTECQLRTVLPGEIPDHKVWERLKLSVTEKFTNPVSRPEKTLNAQTGVQCKKRIQERFGILNIAALIGIVVISAAALQRYVSISNHEREERGKPAPADDGEPKKEAPKPPDDGTTLTEAERTQCESWLKDLDSDDFEVRQRAADKLAGLGLKACDFITARLAKLERDKTGTAETHMALQEALRKIKIDIQLASLNLAVEKAPAHFVPPDPLALRKISEPTNALHQIASFDKTLGDTFSQLSEALGVQILFDPLVQARNTKRVDWSKSGLGAWPNGIEALENICGDTSGNKDDEQEDTLSYVVRGSTVVVTTTERAHKLRLTASNLKLPAAAGEKPWTREQTTAFCDLFSKLYAMEGVGWRSPVERAQVLEGGEVQLEIESSHLKQIQALAEKFGLADLKYKIEQTATETKIEDLMKSRIDFEVKDVKLHEIPWSKFIGPERAGLLSMSIGVDRHDLANMSVKDTPVRDVLLALSRKHSLYIDFYNYQEIECLAVASDPGYLKHYQSDFIQPVQVIDLRPALNAGAPLAELCSRLDEMAREAWLNPGVEIRGRWITRLDRFTLRRAVTLLEEAAKSGKVPPAPPAPWFYQTFLKHTDDKK